jgi:hypothetical protein
MSETNVMVFLFAVSVDASRLRDRYALRAYLSQNLITLTEIGNALLFRTNR